MPEAPWKQNVRLICQIISAACAVLAALAYFGVKPGAGDGRPMQPNTLARISHRIRRN